MLAEQRQAIADLLRQALSPIRAAPDPVELQRPKLPEHGDLSSPVALGLARELYYNDAGAQIDRLATSVQARARELLGEPIDPDLIGYLGEYIVEIARAFLAGATVQARDGAAVQASGDPADLQSVRAFAVA